MRITVGDSALFVVVLVLCIAAKNLLVCPGLPVESEERCVSVWQLNVDGCIWIGRGGREGGGERESMEDLGKKRRHGLGG